MTTMTAAAENANHQNVIKDDGINFTLHKQIICFLFRQISKAAGY